MTPTEPKGGLVYVRNTSKHKIELLQTILAKL